MPTTAATHPASKEDIRPGQATAQPATLPKAASRSQVVGHGNPHRHCPPTNITPDATGIGKNGSTLYPAMPFPSYASVSDKDMKALCSCFMRGVEPMAQRNKGTDIPWPLSMRWPLAIWRGMFALKVQPWQPWQPWQPSEGADAVVSRGAYLVEGLGHCGACHTPRAITMQEKALPPNEGGYFMADSAPLDGWIANLRGDYKDGLGNWTEAQLVQFLKTGRSDRSAVFGGMSDVVEHSMQYMTDAD